MGQLNIVNAPEDARKLGIRNAPAAGRSALRMRLFLPILAAAALLPGCSEHPAEQPAMAVLNHDPSTKEPKTLDRYTLDAQASTFTAKVLVGGVLSMFGHDHLVAMLDFTGEAQFDPETLSGASLKMSIRAGSIVEIGKDFNDEDRKAITQEIHEKALEVSKYGEILFQSTGLTVLFRRENEYSIELRGELTLHGITRKVTIPTLLRLEGDRLTASGQFSIRHSDYGIERLSAAGGMVKAQDDIVLSFTLVGRKQ